MKEEEDFSGGVTKPCFLRRFSIVCWPMIHQFRLCRFYLVLAAYGLKMMMCWTLFETGWDMCLRYFILPTVPTCSWQVKNVFFFFIFLNIADILTILNMKEFSLYLNYLIISQYIQVQSVRINCKHPSDIN